MLLLQQGAHVFSEGLSMILFGILVIIMLAIDLGANRNAHEVSNKEAIGWSLLWISLALLFGIYVYFDMGTERASEYYTAYLIEKALSVDNLFVFILVFGFFKVPKQYHHKVLFWGILGAIFLRAIFIFSGAKLISVTYLPDFDIAGYTVQHLNGILTIFGFFLIYAGIKSFGNDSEEEKDFSNNPGVRLIKLFFPLSEKFDGGNFFTRINGKRFATMLLVVVAVIEFTDLIFAVDSIPAIFTVSQDPFVLYTSNIFAILGLRSLYFLLANMMSYFKYLHYGLAFILTFIGIKMVIAPFFHISSQVSLLVVAVFLIAAAGYSVIKREPESAQ